MLPTIKDVRPLIRDFEPRIRHNVMEPAWDKWMEVDGRSSFSPRSRASMVFDFMLENAINEFIDDPNVHIVWEGQTAKFLFRERVLGRFKKAGRNGLGANIETQRDLEFINNPQRIFPGMLPALYSIEFCYSLNSLETRMELITANARMNRHRLWSFELSRHDSIDVGSISKPEDIDTPPTQIRVRMPKEESGTSE